MWDGFQRGWPALVASDATTAYSAQVHDAALEILAANVAVVATTDEILAAFADARVEVTA